MSIYDIATLADQLAALYPSVEEARRVLTQSGFNTIEIEFSNRPRDNWWNILQAAAYKAGALKTLLTFVMQEYPDNRLLDTLLKETIAHDQPTEKSSGEPESLKAKTAKAFRIFKETVDLEVGGKGLQPELKEKKLQWFQNIIGLSQAVGLIRTPDTFSSAILLRDGYVLTTYLNVTPESIHDIHLYLQYDAGYDELNKTEEVALDPTFIRNNKKLHYTLLRRLEGDDAYELSMPISDIDMMISRDISLISHPSDINNKRINGGEIVRQEGPQLIYRTWDHMNAPGGPVINNQMAVAMHTGSMNKADGAGSLKFGMMITDILHDAGLPLKSFTGTID